MIRTVIFGLTIGVLGFSLGCGGNSGTVLPTTELTEEQKKAVQAEDRAIEMEESQGSINKPKKKK